jgi:two-component system repressor protein LuxO
MASSSPCSKKVVDKHGFREDLYYAMNAVSIPIASLRERSADIPHLANIYLRRHARAFGKEFFGFDPAALEAFKNYPWPGNMLELENAIKSIIALNDGAQFVKLSMLPEWLVRRSDTSDAVPIIAEDDVAEAGHNRIIPIRDLERQAIKRALQLCDGNIQEAALRLKISPATLYRKRPQEESYS